MKSSEENVGTQCVIKKLFLFPDPLILKYALSIEVLTGNWSCTSSNKCPDTDSIFQLVDSTVNGERHSEKLGSWFISCLVKVLQENSHVDDLMTMLTKVNQEMIKYRTDGGSKQIPCHLTMLTRKVYFANFFDKNRPQTCPWTRDIWIVITSFSCDKLSSKWTCFSW